jgi:hypothetical protein
MGKEKKGVGRGEDDYLLQYQEPTIDLSSASISLALAHGALEVKPWLRGRWITIKIQIDRQSSESGVMGAWSGESASSKLDAESKNTENFTEQCLSEGRK